MSCQNTSDDSNKTSQNQQELSKNSVDICHSCTGILLFTEHMKLNKKRPLCIGKLSNLKPQEAELMSDEFFVDKVRRDTSLSGDNIGTYIILGCGQYSLNRIMQNGQLPHCRLGVVLHMQVDDSDDEDTETYAQVAWSTTKSFAATIHNGGTKLGKGMRIVTTKAVAVFPSQFLKGTMKMWMSMKKIPERFINYFRRS